MSEILHTAESAAEGHPDKVADRISDAVLDAFLAQDPVARVACEALVKTGLVLLAGEVTSHAAVDVEQVVRDTVDEIGYDESAVGFDGHTCAVLNALGRQSPDIARGIEHEQPEALGAGDQGIMFGFACRETEQLMPAPIVYAHRLVQRLATLRRGGEIDWLRPDGKSQVTFAYEDGEPAAIRAVVVSAQHAPEASQATVEAVVREQVIDPVLPAAWIDDRTRYYVNPTGRFVLGGPRADCGCTGRKNIVDAYGPGAHHGGGALSGKDPSKVDRSASYAGRYVAKNLVAAGLAGRCEVEIAYAIGLAEPLAISVDSFGTGRLPDQRLAELVAQHFDLRPWAIIHDLQLLRPIYRHTAAYGHFGRDDLDLPWEHTDRAGALADAAGLGPP